jgi:hypothetical protein
VRLPSLSPTSWLAFALVVLGFAFVAIAVACDSLDAWAPNLATEAFAIAVTIAIVERIVRREARERLRPRLESAMDGLRQEFRNFVDGVTWDYAATHLHTFRPLPRDALDFLDHWLAGKEAQDACAVPVPDDPRVQTSLVLYHGVELGKALIRYRELDREVMEPEVVRAIDDYIWHGFQHGQVGFELARRSANPGQGHALAEATIVRAARAFGEVLARHDPRGGLQLDDLTLSAMQEHSDYLRKRGDELAGWRWQPRRDQR